MLHFTMKPSGVFFPWEVNAVPQTAPPLTAARWLHCLDDKSVTVKQVPLQPTGGQCGANRGASTLNNSSSAYRRCSVGGLQL